MSEPKDGGSAFPTSRVERQEIIKGGHSEFVRVNYPGMSLRDYFAAKAMLRMTPEYCDDVDMSYAELARRSYLIADAMLAERAK